MQEISPLKWHLGNSNLESTQMKDSFFLSRHDTEEHDMFSKRGVYDICCVCDCFC